jgi:predicted nucleic acid-binding protein
VSQSAQTQASEGTVQPARYLLDSNLLLRISDRSSRQNRSAKQAVNSLTQSGAFLFITAQNVIEFWSVATRPKAENGLGFTRGQAHRELLGHRAVFTFLPDHAGIFLQWERLIDTYAVEGILAHDTRLAAVALVYKIENFLTFNVKDFVRFSPEGLNIVDPKTVPPINPMSK